MLYIRIQLYGISVRTASQLAMDFLIKNGRQKDPDLLRKLKIMAGKAFKFVGIKHDNF